MNVETRHLAHHARPCTSASADPADKWEFHHSAHRHQIWCWYNFFYSTVRDHRACLASLCWPKAPPELGQLAPITRFASTSTKKGYPVPTDDKAPQPCLSSLLIPAALSQVELYYSMSLSLSQHSNYVKYGIKQAKVQKQQWNSVSSYQIFRHWQSQPSVHINQAT